MNLIKKISFQAIVLNEFSVFHSMLWRSLTSDAFFTFLWHLVVIFLIWSRFVTFFTSGRGVATHIRKVILKLPVLLRTFSILRAIPLQTKLWHTGYIKEKHILLRLFFLLLLLQNVFCQFRAHTLVAKFFIAKFCFTPWGCRGPTSTLPIYFFAINWALTLPLCSTLSTLMSLYL